MPIPRHPVAATAAALLSGGIVLLLGLAIVKAQVSVATLNARERVRDQIAPIARALTVEIDGIYAELTVASRSIDGGRLHATADALSSPLRAGWSYADGVVELSGEETRHPYAEQVRDAVETAQGLSGPFTTPNGLDVILIQVPVGTGNDATLGVSVDLGALFAEVGLIDLLQNGVDVTIVDDSERPVYWSSASSLADAVTSEIDLLGRWWRLAAKPAAGWSGTATISARLVVICVIALAYGLWYLSLATRPASLQREVGELRKRLETKENAFTSLLQSRARLEGQLASSMSIDLETGLANRASFVANVQMELARCRREANGGLIVAVVQFFKLESLSQSMGTAAAQEVIGQAIDRLQPFISMECRLGRIGEKELALSMPANATDPGDVADRLLAALGDGFSVGKRSVYSPAAVGFAVTDDGYEHGPDFVTRASLAATTAMEAGERWSVFVQETREERISLLQLEADLQSAIDHDDLLLYFQPIVSISTGGVVGFESLLRWRHPTESWIGPDRFIPLAESMGQMARISQWVLKKAVQSAAQWVRLRDVPVYVSVNLTPRDLSRETCNLLFELLDSAGLPPECIRIEITETALVRDFNLAARLIAELNERGVRVLLDDFGTGYSSLSYLKDLPFHTVKIDRSFIERMTTEARDFGLVRSIVGLVHYLGMECVAEGIETQEQLDLVGMADCDCGQGYYFSRPVAPESVARLINDDFDRSRQAAS